MTHPSLTELESAVLDMILAGDTRALGILREQLAHATVASRELTGVGFFTRLAIPAGAPRLTHDRLVFGDVDAEIESLAHGAGFVLFVEQGVLHTLEGYTYDEPWPHEVRNFRLRYSGPERALPPQLAVRSKRVDRLILTNYRTPAIAHIRFNPESDPDYPVKRRSPAPIASTPTQ